MSLCQPFFHHRHHHHNHHNHDHTVNILEQNLGVHVSLNVVVLPKVTGCAVIGFCLLKLELVMDLF